MTTSAQRPASNGFGALANDLCRSADAANPRPMVWRTRIAAALAAMALAGCAQIEPATKGPYLHFVNALREKQATAQFDVGDNASCQQLARVFIKGALAGVDEGAKARAGSTHVGQAGRSVIHCSTDDQSAALPFTTRVRSVGTEPRELMVHARTLESCRAFFETKPNPKVRVIKRCAAA